MNILFDINHPADVHFFKFTMEKLKRDGHEIFITARDKDVVLSLLHELELPFTKLSTSKGGLVNLAIEMLLKDIRLLSYFIRNKIDLAVAFTGTCTSQVGWLLRTPRLVFYDNDEAKLQNLLTYPFATKIFTPDCYPHDLGKKHERFSGIKELAYLHPDYFQPDKNVYTKLGIEQKDKYIIIRTVAWQASHDRGQSGLSKDNIRKLIKLFSDKYKIFIIPEAKIDPEFEEYLLPTTPNDIHHVLAFSDLFIGEGATMACECACLGTPSIYVNTLNPSHVVELEKVGLINYAANGNKVVKLATSILRNSEKIEWNQKTGNYISSNNNITTFIYNKINEYSGE